MLHLTAFASKFASTRFSKTANVSINSVSRAVRACMHSDLFSFAIFGINGVCLGINGALVFHARPADVEHDRRYDALLSKYNAQSKQNRELTARLADLQASQTSCKVRT
jgi:hypothetical protein